MGSLAPPVLAESIDVAIREAQSTELFSCQGEPVDAVQTPGVDVGGCGSSDICIQRTASNEHERDIVLVVQYPSMPAAPSSSSFVLSEVHALPDQTARDGPLYELSVFLAHSLLKRE
jgi:hypothetical protein